MKELWYFSAPWCGPCKMFGPTMDRVASQGINVKKINIDYAADAITKYGVRSVPTTILVDGEGVILAKTTQMDAIKFAIESVLVE